MFPKGGGHLKPSTFLQLGKGNAGAPDGVAGYAYFYGQRQGRPAEFYLGRAAPDRLPDRAAYEFLCALEKGRPAWSSDVDKAAPVFTDTRPNGDLAAVVYVPGLDRYLLTSFHKGPGELGVFDAPAPLGAVDDRGLLPELGRDGQ